MKLFYFSLLMSVFNLTIISQNCGNLYIGQTEIAFTNNLNYPVTVTYYPAGAVYTSTLISSGDQIATMLTRHLTDGIYYTENGYHVNVRVDYLGMLRIEQHESDWHVEKLNSLTIPGNSYKYGLNCDPLGNGSANDDIGSFGYGKYKFVFSWTPTSQDDAGTDYCYYETDADVSDAAPDLWFIFTNGTNGPEIRYKFTPYICTTTTCQPISIVNRYIKTWQPYPPNICSYGRNKNLGNFFYKSDSPYSLFPLDPRRYCNLPNPNYPWARNQNLTTGVSDVYGNIAYNLHLQKTVTTPKDNEMIDFPTRIRIDTNVWLTIENNVTLTIQKDGNWPAQPSRHSELILFPESNLHFAGTSASSSILKIQKSGLLCDYDGKISGVGTIIMELNNMQCPGYQDFLIQDSTQIIVQDTATWALEDSSKITLDGNITALILKPYSTIKFGPHAKLILKNGARLKADHCTFTALNAGDTWDGIYLNDLAQDTITNCTIENAVNGINIINRNGSASRTPPPYSTIITNCTFTNTTSSTQLTNAIYANNSDNILIQNDSIISNTAQ